MSVSRLYHVYTPLEGSVRFLQTEQIYVIIHLPPTHFSYIWIHYCVGLPFLRYRGGHKSNYKIFRISFTIKKKHSLFYYQDCFINLFIYHNLLSTGCLHSMYQ